MVDILKEKIIWPVILFLITSLVALGINWVKDDYNKPRLIVDSNYQYSKLAKESVGNILISNFGNSTDEDIVLIVNASVEKSQIVIDGAVTNNRVEKISEGQTKFVIDKLNQTDSALISFSTITDAQSFELSYSSKSQKIEDTVVSPRWWNTNSLQKTFIGAISLSTFLLGVCLGKPLKPSNKEEV